MNDAMFYYAKGVRNYVAKKCGYYLRFIVGSANCDGSSGSSGSKSAPNSRAETNADAEI
jgi:hypothetical protein